MKKLLVVVLAAAFMTGCSAEQQAKMQADWNKTFGGGKGDEQAKADASPAAQTQPAAAVSSSKGKCLKVFIDEQEAALADVKDGKQYWKATMSSTPKLRYEIVEKQLGRIKSAEILLSPLVDGKADVMDIWQLPAVDLKPGETRAFSKFHRVKNAQTQPVAESLPAGSYLLTVTVDDDAGLSDTQSIFVDIK